MLKYQNSNEKIHLKIDGIILINGIEHGRMGIMRGPKFPTHNEKIHSKIKTHSRPNVFLHQIIRVRTFVLMFEFVLTRI